MTRLLPLLATLLCLQISGCAEAEKTGAPTLEAPLKSLSYGGEGHHLVELDGYGTCLVAHWVAADVEGGLAGVNHPYVSVAVPVEYKSGGAPIAYVRGSKPTFSASFRAPEQAAAEVQVSGEVEAEFHLGSDEPELYQARISGVAKLVDGEWVATELKCDHPLPDRVGYSDAFTIRWSVSDDNGASSEVTRTVSQLYLLRQAPVEGVPLLHTPVNLACRAAAGLDEDAEIIEAVWQPFAKLNVARARDGKLLEYYGTYQSTASELRGFLLCGSGQCTTWSHLQHCALGALGIDSDITGVFPASSRGGILVHRWTTLEGEVFISSGPNGICETTASGDDVQAIAVGAGRPNTRAVDAVPMETTRDQLKGDDLLRFRMVLPGSDGIVQTELDPEHFLPVVPLGFGQAQQRGYQITDPKAVIEVAGDDTLSRDAKGNGWVMTGPNGILETLPQEGMKNASTGRVTVAVGGGSTGLNLRTYLAKRRLAAWPRECDGDDVAHDNSWISTGDDGIAQTAAGEGEKQLIPVGQGEPDVPVIGPGPNGVIDTVPQGDDVILDEREAHKLAGEDFPYVNGLNTWPLEGVVGQQTTNPPAGFPNHVILSVGGILYDPSYGTGPFPDHAAWEKASLFGTSTQIKDAEGKSIRRSKVRTVGRLSFTTKMLDPN